MKFTTILKNKSFLFVKKQFTNKEGKLLKYLAPAGCEVVHHRGLRRGSITRILMLSRLITFKVVTYTTDRNRLYFNDILKEGDFFGIKFWSHRHTVEKCGPAHEDTAIIDEIEFTTKNKALDSFYKVLLTLHFLIRKVKYKLFFKIN